MTVILTFCILKLIAVTVSRLYWLENTAGTNTTPVFNLPPVNLNITNALSYRLYDWNNNGCLDIVVYGVNAETRVYFNDCAGNFSFGLGC